MYFAFIHWQRFLIYMIEKLTVWLFVMILHGYDGYDMVRYFINDPVISYTLLP